MHCLIYTVYNKTFEGENFHGCAQNTIHWKTFAVHQAHAIMYCTQQMIQGENFRDWLKNHENRKSFPPQKFCRIRYALALGCCTPLGIMHLYHTTHSCLCYNLYIHIFIYIHIHTHTHNIIQMHQDSR